MKKRYTTAFCLLIYSLTFIVGCTNDSPTPSADISQLQGQYTTNGLLDPSCVFISDASQLPSLTITRQPDGTFRLVRTDYIPSKSTNTLDGASVNITPDTTFILHDGKQIGKLFMSTFPDFNSPKSRDITAARLSVMYSDPTAQKFLGYSGYRR
ncbi:hypothetical protein [Persicitalea jodogahamensis]|uniref:Lipoprotein n=1 Tax=Persicitalea jodogahamensis TaxID=402147 RepID=A0A8J3GBE4_9BACT|nr:hypothetical protein [Persicitalea jodogahamensis]GHB81118.1 hypothetical protein GCM10007390_39780 [Persicitalea jodogahamensis]